MSETNKPNSLMFEIRVDFLINQITLEIKHCFVMLILNNTANPIDRRYMPESLIAC